MNSLAIFNYGDSQVRTIEKDGELHFVATDVCSILGINRTSDAVSRLDDDEKGAVLIDTLGGKQNVLAVNESGLYSLILTSRKPEARKFKKWVTSEVLPAIRRTGKYDHDPLQVLNDPSAMRGLLLSYSEKVIQRDKLIAVIQPKAEALDRLSMAEGSLCITNAAKTLQVQPKFLFNLLSKEKFIYRRPGRSNWTAYQDKLQTGYLEHKITTIERTGDDPKTVEQVLVTPKGLVKLASMIGHS